MTEKVTGLTLRQRRALEALLQARTISQAAERAKVSRKTIYIWLGQTAFRDELNRLGRLVLEEVTDRMSILASEAVEILSSVLRTAGVPIGNQIQAASIILKRASELWELYDLSRLYGANIPSDLV